MTERKKKLKIEMKTFTYEYFHKYEVYSVQNLIQQQMAAHLHLLYLLNISKTLLLYLFKEAVCLLCCVVL